MTKLDDLNNRIFAVELLKELKRNGTYRDISRFLDLPPSVISRYINGHVLPDDKKTDKIIDLFKEKFLVEMIRLRVMKDESGAYDLMPVSYDTNLQKIIAKAVFFDFGKIKIDKIFTAATDGISIGTQISNQFGVDLVIAKKEKEPGVDEFLEERAVFSPVVFKNFYIPKGSIKKNESVFIIDDIVRTGATIEALIRFVEESKGKVVGIFTIFSVDDAVGKLKKRLHLRCEVKSLVHLS